MSPSDTALLGRWMDRHDPEAFSTLAKRYAPMIYATSMRILANTAEAEDVTQECFERLATMKKGPKGHLGAWLHCVAANRAIDHYRRDKRRQARDTQYIAEQPRAEVPVWDDVYAFVDEAIAGIPAKFRDPLVAHYLEGRTHERIARDLGISRQAVSRRIAKGVDAVRDTLRRRGISLASTALATLFSAHLAEAAALPPALESTLGKLAVAGLPGASTATVSTAAASAMGGALVMKKAIIAIAVLMAALGSWKMVSVISTEPPPESSEPISLVQENNPPAAEPAESTEQSAAAAPERAASPENTSDEVVTVEGGTISGRVVDAKTKAGIADVTIQANGRTSVRSDTQGHYRFTGLGPGDYKLRLSAVPGYPRENADRKQLQVSLIQDEGLEEVNFSIEPGISISGCVVSEDGQPVNKAFVGAMLEGMPRAEKERTGEDGRFLISIAKPGSDLHIKASTDGFESRMQGPYELTERGLSGLVLTLDEEKKSSISGTVVDPKGRPIKGAAVRLQRGKADYMVHTGDAETKADGSFTIENLVAGEYSILVLPSTNSTWSELDEVDRVTLGIAEKRAGLRLVLGADKGGKAISGYVVDSAGKPIEGVEVVAMGDVHEKGCSGKDGSFVITGLTEGPYVLTAMALAGHRNFGHTQMPRISTDTNDVEVVMLERSQAEGRVLRADTGEPIAGYELFVRGGKAEQYDAALLMNREEVHNAEGKFTRDLDAGWFTLTARAPGFAPAFQNVEVHEHEVASGIELRLSPAQRYTGVVLDVEGNPLANAKLYPDRMPDQFREGAVVATTDADGSFALDSVSPETRQIVAVHPEYAPGRVPLSENMRIILPEGGNLEGKLTRGGAPLAQNAITIRYRGEYAIHSMTAQASREGTYRFPNLLPGTVEISVGTNDKRRLSCDAVIDAGKTTVVDLDFEAPTGTLYGQVYPGQFTPEKIMIACQVATTSGMEKRSAEAGPDGSYCVENVPAGEVQLSAQIFSKDGLDLKRFVTCLLKEEENLLQDIDFAGGGTLLGTMHGITDTGQAGMFVFWGDVNLPETPGQDFYQEMQKLPPELMVTHVLVGSGGAYQVNGLAPGTYSLVAGMMPPNAQAPGEMRFATAVTAVTEGEVTTLDFDFR